ncbi:hypothetical protein ACFT4A_31450 [Streptomyces sp. NPDC057099]|uniref:hypothetical protein n=1 Tax=Streptomyces sp. NPDC057099 TaxID=3346019 RepID=UPI00363F0B55
MAVDAAGGVAGSVVVVGGGPDGLAERDVADRCVGVLGSGPPQALAGGGVGPYLFGLPESAAGVGGLADQQ